MSEHTFSLLRFMLYIPDCGCAPQMRAWGAQEGCTPIAGRFSPRKSEGSASAGLLAMVQFVVLSSSIGLKGKT
ncbi:hypothetical protein L1887_36679 [Cichorium endivia]|nr:hypothetical protein L1887_36679 [Cichorium endivia]